MSEGSCFISHHPRKQLASSSKVANSNNNNHHSKSEQQDTRARISPSAVIEVIASSRLPFASSSSTTSSSSGATTAGQHSLNAPLIKLSLVTCYYLVAIASLLVLVLYMNQFACSQATDSFSSRAISGLMPPISGQVHELEVEQQQQQKRSRAKRSIEFALGDNNSRREQQIEGVIFSYSAQPSSPLRYDSDEGITFVAVNEPSASSQFHHSMRQRFGPGEEEGGIGAATSGLIPEPTMVLELKTETVTDPHNHPHHLQLPPKPQRFNINAHDSGPQPSVELAPTPDNSQQVPRAYSPNNRGSLGSASTTTKAPPRVAPQPSDNQGQWIPLLSPPLQQAASSAARQLSNRPPTSGQEPRITTTRQQLGRQRPVTASPAATSTRQVHPNNPHAHYNQHQQQASSMNSYHYHRNYPRPMEPYSSHHRHWRRPRLNIGYDWSLLPPPPPMRPRAKLYKRVLLCDKTLVSLDYVRNLNIDMLHSLGGGHYDSDFDDNIIDLGSQLEPVYAHKPAASASTNGSKLTTEPIGESTTAKDPLAVASSENLIRSFNRRSFLTEEDPLVKCDMWDLEKGLKNRKPPREILQMAVKADFDTVRDAINRCRQLSEKTLPPDDEFRDGIEIMSTEDLMSLFSMKRGLIPGTKWCGLGDQASSYNDLGSKHRIDVCCRAHDHCPIRLKPFRNDYGVLNIALYTKSHCDCDADFYRCLREVHSKTADMLGNLYFNVMKLQCMREERVKICRKAKPIALGFERCVKYEENPMKTVFKFTTPPVAY